MSTRRLTQIGLDRLVRLKWMERVSSLVLADNKAKDIKVILQNDLRDSFRSERTDVRGSLDKTITILTKTWLVVPKDLEAIRVEGLELLKQLPVHQHIVVHWGMLMAVYPFWAGVAAQVGRLLRLQSTFTIAQVQRRVRENYGERETVSRRARYVLRSYVDWGVIEESGSAGLYKAGLSIQIEDTKLIAWFVETMLNTQSNQSATMRDLTSSPSAFPFHIKKVSADSLFSMSKHVEVIRHSLDEDMVMLRKPLAEEESRFRGDDKEKV